MFISLPSLNIFWNPVIFLIKKYHVLFRKFRKTPTHPLGTFRHMFYQKSNCTPGNISLCSITEITRKANLIISLFRTQMWGEFCWIMWQRGALCCNTAVIEQSWYSYSLQSKFSLYFNLEHFGTTSVSSLVVDTHYLHLLACFRQHASFSCLAITFFCL